MAEAAYELERFAPAARKKAPLKMAKPQKRSGARAASLLRMARTLLCVLILGLLVSGLLYTQARLTELQTNIAAGEKRLTEEKALNTYLSFELDSMTSLKNVEQRAGEMDLGHIGGEQVSYFRTDDGVSIQVRENPLAAWFGSVRAGFLSVVDFFRQ